MANTLSIPYNFTPRDIQKALWRFMQKGGFKKKRAVVVAHRRWGKDLNAIHLAFTAAVERPGLYWHVFPTYAQGKKIAWDGKTKEGKPFLEAFPKEMVVSTNHTEMKKTFRNGAIYQVVGADKPDSLVGANPVGIIMSEWSLMNPSVWELVMPILAENEGWAIFIFTPRGKNHGWKKLKEAMKEMELKNPNWFAAVYKNSETHVIPEEAIEEMRKAGMPEEMIEQEIECSFEAAITGAYYGKEIAVLEKNNRICNLPYEVRLPVNTAWDLGVGDSTAIWFYQVYGHEIRIIDYYEASGEGLPHYAKVLGGKPYVYGSHYAPHDIEVKELGSGKTRRETAAQLGIKFVVGKQFPIDEGIEATRSLLPRCWFDRGKTEKGLEALKQYHKDWDDDKQTFRDKPCHDWSSHAADAFRELSMSFKNRPRFAIKPQIKAINDYDCLAIG